MIEIPIEPTIAALGGSLTLSWHGLFSFIAVAAAVFLVGRWAPARGVHPDDIYSIAIWAIIGGIIGARIVHVIDNWTLYQSDPIRVLFVWGGGIGLWGGILGGFAGGTAYALIRNHPVGIIADLAAPAMLISQTIGRIGDIVNGEHCAQAWDFALGFIWTSPVSNAAQCVNGDGVSVHPVIAYEMVWNSLALVLIWKLRNRLRPDGMLFALYLALYALGRFGVTFFREDRVWAFGWMQEAHLIAMLVLIAAVPLLIIKARPRPASETAEILETAATDFAERGTRAERRRRARE